MPKSYQDAYKMILIFLWKWKLSSTAAMSARFFSDLPAHSAYKKLLSLEAKGLIQGGSEPFTKQVVWTLTKAGFESILGDLPALKEEGFKSEHLEHDRIVTAVHIGDALLNHKLGLETLSEQQLRRYHQDSLPIWAPTSKLHRPDGYWYKAGKTDEPSIISLEVEISSKNNSAYYSVARFYARHPSIGRIVWVCRNQKFAARILDLLIEGDPEARSTHSFFILGDVERLGWGALAKVGAGTGKTLRSMLVSVPEIATPDFDRIKGGFRLEEYPAALLFDYRKCVTKFKDYSTWLKSQKVPLTP